jgi:hypothetical protein
VTGAHRANGPCPDGDGGDGMGVFAAMSVLMAGLFALGLAGLLLHLGWVSLVSAVTLVTAGGCAVFGDRVWRWLGRWW